MERSSNKISFSLFTGEKTLTLLPALLLAVITFFGAGIGWAIVVFSAVALLIWGILANPVFILRRTVWVIAVWLGVVLVTFGAVHVAPVDVPEGRGHSGFSTLTPEEIESFKRTHGLDLPIFLNLDIRDRKTEVTRNLDALLRKTDPEAKRNLIRLGTLTFPELPRLLKQTNEAALSELMLEIVGRIDPANAPSNHEGLESWWEKNKNLYRPSRIRKTVTAAIRGEVDAEQRLFKTHKRALPFLMEILRTGDDTERARACNFLSLIAERSWRCGVEMPQKERLTSLSLWREYYRRNELSFNDVKGFARVYGAFTRTRFFTWISRIAMFEFGSSRYFGRPVSLIIWERLPVTLALGLTALFFAYALAVPLGVIAGSRPGSRKDRIISIVFTGLYCIPVFWLGMMLILTLGGIQGPALFPHSGIGSTDPSTWPLGSRILDRIHHMILPVICLSTGSIAILGRYGRDAMADTITEDYIRTAWAKGLGPGRVYWIHGLRNASLPQINLLGLQLPYLLSGSVIVESIFDIPGLGMLAYTAIEMRDLNLLMGLISITAMIVLLGQLLGDMLSLAADPRTSADSTGPDGQ